MLTSCSFVSNRIWALTVSCECLSCFAMTRHIFSRSSYQIWNLRSGPVANCIFIFLIPLLSPAEEQHSEKSPRARNVKRSHFMTIGSGVRLSPLRICWRNCGLICERRLWLVKRLPLAIIFSCKNSR